MLRTAVALAALATIGAASPPQDSVFERGYSRERFVAAGFTPIEEADWAGRDVRRLLPSDPYMILPVPGIEIERRANGRVTLRLQYRGWASEPVTIDRAAWQDLSHRERAAFAPPPPAPRPTGSPATHSSCHSWSVQLQATGGRHAAWSPCPGARAAEAVRAYAVRMIELALATRPDCKRGDDVFDAFEACFRPSRALDDPRLDAEFATLRAEYDAVDSARPLGLARSALAEPGLVLGSPGWKAAREAIAKVKETNDYRRARLDRLRALAFRARGASPADKAKINDALLGWSQFLDAQDRNYSELVTRLAWMDR